MKKSFTFLICALLMLSLSGCVSTTNVHFNTNVDDAEVYVDGMMIGTTPVSAKLSNAIWKTPDITIKKEGYRTLNTAVKKEVVISNLVIGYLIWFPAYFWCYGPKDDQYFILEKSNISNAENESSI